MSVRLHIVKAGPGLSLQDFGRPGYLASGLSRGGAMDPLALAEGAALMRMQAEEALAIEMAGAGGRFRAEGGDLLIALTGAPMQARLDGARLHWPGSYLLREGAELEIGGASAGSYGYLSVAGLDAPSILGARSAHLAGGIGGALSSGTRLDAQPAPNAGGLTLTAQDRFSGGLIRVLPSVQTDQFGDDARGRFEATEFRKDARASRMGARMAHDGDGFSQDAHLAILSEIIVPGDIQVIGDGAPFVLLPECQTMGGYPRIATVIAADLPRVAQAAPGTALRFRFVELEEALKARAAAARHRKALPDGVTPRIRDPHDIPDLLSYQLVGGVVSAKAEE
ncbi:5-oxoprolinase subunit C family protein [Alterinioella nitratireducens]|uniref:5-oxoprolinase subunit C family protein n=1 Tax=Alterinioella nitratireducens TaxID=2735915 RepID=UPI0015571F3F|nr:biotin-dependent carboxyltransferase family protein [Alterinioella nitratireducens]NPD20835.1 biotin-dependent carboxyltransferase family protein [Alterinioella nitratireducens]